MTHQDAWYYSHDGQDRVGPMSWKQIQEYYKGGVLSSETLLWAPHLAEWTPAQQLIRVKRGKGTTLKAALIVAASFVGLLTLGGIVHAVRSRSLSDNLPERIVRNGHLTQYPSKTVGKAVNDFFGNPKWESGTGVDGETKGKTLVNAGGTIRYMDKEVNAVIQFVVNELNGTFELKASEVSDMPQDIIMKQVLIAKMY